MFKLIAHHSKVLLSHFRTIATGKKRSSKWNSLKKEFLKKHPVCEVCGSHKKLQVHHIKPFHLFPELELDVNNLITLCMDKHECHLSIGHGNSFRSFCPNLRSYIAMYKSGEKTFKEICAIAKKERSK